MDIEGVDLNLMVAFTAIYTERQISRAAKRIGLSQPAMSAALARLRTVYQDPLFVRSPQGMMPTHRAKQLEGPISKALELLRASLIPEAPFNPLHCDKSFRLSLSDWMCINLIPVLSARLQHEAPAVQLTIRNISNKEMPHALMNGELDLAISGQPYKEPGLYRQILYREHYECFVWRGHSAIRNNLTLKDYVRFPHLLFSPEGAGIGAVDKALAKKKLKRKIAVRVVYSLAMPVMIQNTDLIATVPAPIARYYAKFLEIKVFDPPIALPEHDIIQYWNKENHTDPAHRWFRALVAEICK